MSALAQVHLVILPRVYATAEPEAGFAACRKGPHGLRLVAPAASAARAPLSLVPREPKPMPMPMPAVELAFYRKYTEALLERYMAMSMEAGRVPSLMGRELFPGHSSHTRVTGFDDVVAFVHDVGNCLALLTPAHQHLLRRIACHGYTQAEAAALDGISLRSVVRHYARALDQMTRVLMERELLQPAGVSASA